MLRDLDSLTTTPFDVLVIGGGILGASIARDAALRGFRVALVERGDWGSGTTANSLRIVHGGLRYLQRLDFRRMRQSIRERSYWLRVAPHLVEPLPVLVPTYGFGLRGREALRVALMVNDVIARDRNERLPPERQLPSGRAITRAECLAMVPQFEGSGLTGGILFHDAQMFSSERLALETVIGAVSAGAHVANYVEVVAPLRRAGRLQGVRAHDRTMSSAPFDIRARIVVNAAGPAGSSIASTLLGRRTSGPTDAYTIGINLAVEPTGHAVAFAINGPASDPNVLRQRGNRQLFVVPWRGTTLIGTAHLPFDGDPSSFEVADRDVETFLTQVNVAWGGHRWKREDVRAVQAGLLPGESRSAHDVRLDTKHRVVDHASDGEPALISATSVKFTTARLVAEQTVDLACARLGSWVPCRTLDTPFPGAPAEPVRDLQARASREWPAVPRAVITHLIRMYGKRYTAVLGVAGSRVPQDWLEPLDRASPTVFAQLVYGARHEMACTTDDLLRRRTELGAVGRLTSEVVARAHDALGLALARVNPSPR